MHRFRSGKLTEEDIERINKRVGIEPQEKTQVASCTDRDVFVATVIHVCVIH